MVSELKTEALERRRRRIEAWGRRYLSFLGAGVLS